MPKLKLQYFGHLIQRFNSLGKTLMLEKIGGRRRKRQHGGMTSLTQSMDLSLSKFQGIVKDREAWCAAVLMLRRVGTI